MLYVPRISEPLIERYLNNFTVVGLTGCRQSGKSTVLRHLYSKKYRYVTFDDAQIFDQFSTDPDAFMSLYDNRVIFDEAQKVPELFNYVKIAVDNDRDNMGKYFLTGSSQFSFQKNITESLAGRIGLINQLPFQLLEIPEQLREQAIYKGCYPELVLREYRESSLWYSSYIGTYLERDVKNLFNIGDIRDFRRFMTILASRCSQILDIVDVSKELGLSGATVKKWISILEASYIIFLLPPYYKNISKRVVKRPKLYFYDTGLLAYLTQIETAEHFESGPMKGEIFENFVISDIWKNKQHRGLNVNLSFYRDNHKNEIDLIVEYGQYKDVIEIKSSHKVSSKMLTSFNYVYEKGDQKILLYRGEAVENEMAKILNYQDYLLGSIFREALF